MMGREQFLVLPGRHVRRQFISNACAWLFTLDCVLRFCRLCNTFTS